MARVAIVIVTWNSGGEIGACLDALAKLTDVEIVVVDNASEDGTREEAAARGARIIANPNNAGFGAAVNQGVGATSAPLVLLLNPDAHLVSGVDALEDEFRDAKTGAAGGLLLGSDGLPQKGFMARNLPTPAALVFEVLGMNKLWPANPVNWNYRCLGKDSAVRNRVEQPAGAFLMFSRRAWAEVRGFDERFWPIWFEDVAFCASLKEAGFAVYYNPNSVARHAGAHSIRTLPVEIRERYWYGSLLGYAAKTYGPPAYRVVCFAVGVSAAVRALAGYRRYGWKSFAVYGNVCRFALGRFFGFRRGSENTVV